MYRRIASGMMAAMGELRFYTFCGLAGLALAFQYAINRAVCGDDLEEQDEG